MSATFKSSTLIAVLLGVLSLAAASNSHAQYQQRRFEPSRPTVSPYLNLFRFNNSVIPNYQSLVRPEQQAQRFRQQQLQLDRQQQQELQRLQSNVRVLQQPRVTSELVAPTGKGSWFNVPGGSTFGDTSGYFSRVGGGGNADH
jgi:multidrug efflux pump subunit AcrA (membrane-fusion protein)